MAPAPPATAFDAANLPRWYHERPGVTKVLADHAHSAAAAAAAPAAVPAGVPAAGASASPLASARKRVRGAEAVEAEAVEAEAEAAVVSGGGEVVLGALLCMLRTSPSSSRASSPPSAALATLATTESAASGLDRSRLWCARNVAASWRSGGSAPSLQMCRGAERCRDTKAKWCSDA